MNKPLRILIVEDSENDVLLLLRELRRGGYEPAYEHVETAEGMKAALDHHEWDLVLSDHSMPHFGSALALEIMKERNLDVPFIIVSGTIGEDAAVSAIKGGAHDYIIKGNLARLLPAIERALRDAEERASRRRVEQALRESEDRYRDLVEHSHDLICTHDLDGRILSANPTAARLLGYGPTDYVDKNLRDLLVPEFRDRFDEYLNQIKREGVVSGLMVVQSRTGERRVWEYHNTLRTEGVAVPIVRGMAHDITERKRVEDTLRQAEEQYRLLFQSHPQAMWIYDDETLAFLAVNDAAIHQYEYSREEFLGMTIEDIRPPEDLPALREYITTKPIGISEAGIWRHRKKNGAIIDVEITSCRIDFLGRPAGLLVANDITEQKRLEHQLRQAQKMEAIGQLAGGIAHDFNNLLTAIIGYSQMILRRLNPEDANCKELEEIERAGRRAAGLTQQLLAFSRKQVLQPKVVSLNDVVAKIDKLLRRLIGENIDLIVKLNPLAGYVNIDPGQLDQVIMNLAVNARDAMPQGGKLIIETANVDLDESYASQRVDAKPGPHVLLAISDTGCGMDRDTLGRIFEPFFTTKEQSKGTGLGLSTVYGIIKQSGGSIWVYSEPGHGTTFKIYLPEVEAADKGVQPSAAVIEMPRGSESILLVEDEEAVRTFVRRVLEAHGYAILEASNPHEALSHCARPSVALDMILTDVIMPQMSGRELAEKVRVRYPQIKVLYMSGYTDDAIIHHGVLDADVAFIQKPLTPRALLHKVREVLGGQ